MLTGSVAFVLVIFTFGVSDGRYHGHHNKTHHHGHHRNHPSPKFERMTVVDADTGVQYNPYSKHHPGRHVCTQQRDALPNKEPCHKPVYKKYKQRCNNNQICNGIKVIYETSYKDVPPGKNNKQTVYVCCPGWTQISNRSNGCNKPKCSTPCENGGTCVKPDVCNCPKGFRGKYCEEDIDECKEMKPCDQMCYNTVGNYECQCRENFVLQSDGQTCRSEINDPGLEAKDLEFESLDKRLSNLENILANTNGNVNHDNYEIRKINNNIDAISHDINVIQNKMQDWEIYKNDLFSFKNKLLQVEKKMVKVDDLSATYDKMKRCAMYKKICI